MTDKERERKPLKVVLKSTMDFDGYRIISKDDQERPDFVFEKGNQILGVEHIELPLLPFKGQDVQKLFKNKTNMIYRDWKDVYSSHGEEVTRVIEKHINDKLEAYSEFTHTDYLISCASLLGVGPQEKRKHDATEYIRLLKDSHPVSEVKIAFLLDIGYDSNDISHFQYRSSPIEKFHKQRLLDYPFTMVFLVLLGMIKDVRDIYIVWHPFDDYDSKYVRCYAIHLDENGRYTADLNLPRVWWEFDMPETMKTTKVKLEYKKEED